MCLEICVSPGLPGGKEEHPLGLTGLVNLSKLDFLLGRGMDREKKKKDREGSASDGKMKRWNEPDLS